MQVAIGVVGHNQRGDQAADLMHQVGAVYRSMDNGTLGCDHNHRRVWKHLAGTTTDWVLVLEDDAIPCDDFPDQLKQALTHTPTNVLSLYLGTSRPVWYQPRGEKSARKLQPLITDALAKADDACYLTAPKLFHAVAVAIRTSLVRDMLAWTTESKRPIDYAISDWCEARGHTVAYTLPSIVQHADGDTLFTHPDRQPRNRPRIAHQHGTRETWTTRSTPLEEQP